MSESTAHGMTRRRFVAAGGAATAGLAAPSVARAQPRVLIMQSSWQEHDIFHEMAREYVDRVERMAGGRLRIDLRPTNAFVAANLVHEACHEGTIDACQTVPTMLNWWHPAAGLFGAGPTFGGDPAVMLGWMHRGGGKALYDELVREHIGFDIVTFQTLAMPAQPFGWFRHHVETPADLEGLRYRAISLAVDWARAMGMVVARMYPSELKPAMERGLLDALELNNPTMDRNFGAHEVANYYIMASFNQTFEMLEVAFNRETFLSLPEDIQAILEHAAEATSTSNHATALDRYSRDLRRLIDEDGVEVSRTSRAILEFQLQAWDKVLAEHMDDPYFARVVESQREWCERVAFYDLTNRPDFRMAYEHFFPTRLPA
jgi:TRAP-type mannitol/chloroaromatic compound transport system substrate-binding protein